MLAAHRFHPLNPSRADAVWDLVKRCSHSVDNWEIRSPQELSCLLEHSECFLMWSQIVILRSGCIASLTVLNSNLKDHLKKVFDCVRVIHTPL